MKCLWSRVELTLGGGQHCFDHFCLALNMLCVFLGMWLQLHFFLSSTAPLPVSFFCAWNDCFWKLDFFNKSFITHSSYRRVTLCILCLIWKVILMFELLTRHLVENPARYPWNFCIGIVLFLNNVSYLLQHLIIQCVWEEAVHSQFKKGDFNIMCSAVTLHCVLHLTLLWWKCYNSAHCFFGRDAKFCKCRGCEFD